MRKPWPLRNAPPKPQWRGHSPGNVTTEPGQYTSLQCPHGKYPERQLFVLFVLKRLRQRHPRPPQKNGHQQNSSPKSTGLAGRVYLASHTAEKQHSRQKIMI